MQNDYSQFEQRKRDHIDLALLPSNQTAELNTFDELTLIHEALPDINFNDISIQASRFGKSIPSPLFISSMTAGHANAVNINQHLVAACAITGWAMGVGSQRRELTDKEAAKEWYGLRQAHPNVSLFSNIGIAQLIHTPLHDIQRLVDSIHAEAIIIHCNPLQECIQPEGTPEFKGSWEALHHLTQNIDVPVIVKETGCGFSSSTLNRLKNLGIAAVDVSGLGGTHWGRIEGHRAGMDSPRQQASASFRNWGIDTVQSVKHAIAVQPDYEIWGSGGVRNGLDAAKLIALGASSVGFAKCMLERALVSTDQVIQLMNTIEYELKTAMFCTGSSMLTDLREKIRP